MDMNTKRIELTIMIMHEWRRLFKQDCHNNTLFEELLLSLNKRYRTPTMEDIVLEYDGLLRYNKVYGSSTLKYIRHLFYMDDISSYVQTDISPKYHKIITITDIYFGDLKKCKGYNKAECMIRALDSLYTEFEIGSHDYIMCFIAAVCIECDDYERI